MGLGLAIVRRLVQGMGGKVWVESDQGAGCKFSFPHSLQTCRQPCRQRKKSMRETAKILLVDDEPAMLRYIRTLLEVDDYKVETASTGEEALQRVDKGMEPDLVLLDVLMPGIDGLETLEQLRHKRPGVKVVMLSCVNDTKKVVQAMRLGAHDYLTKPFQKAELDAVIDQCLGRVKRLWAEKPKKSAMTSSLLPPARHAEDSIASRAGRACGYSRAAAGRKRHRQGSAGAADSQAFAARAPYIPESKLRGGSRRSAGERTVRLRARRLHRSDARQAGQVRIVQQGYDPARRNRRDASGAAGQAAACVAGPEFLAAGQPLA